MCVKSSADKALGADEKRKQRDYRISAEDKHNGEIKSGVFCP